MLKYLKFFLFFLFFCGDLYSKDKSSEVLPYPSNKDFIDAFGIVRDVSGKMSMDKNKLIYTTPKKYSSLKLLGFKDEIIQAVNKVSKCGSQRDEIMVAYLVDKKSDKGTYRAGLSFECDGSCTGAIELVSLYNKSGKNFKESIGFSPVVALDSSLCRTVWLNQDKIINRNYLKYVE